MKYMCNKHEFQLFNVNICETSQQRTNGKKQIVQNKKQKIIIIIIKYPCISRVPLKRFGNRLGQQIGITQHLSEHLECLAASHFGGHWPPAKIPNKVEMIHIDEREWERIETAKEFPSLVTFLSAQKELMSFALALSLLLTNCKTNCKMNRYIDSVRKTYRWGEGGRTESHTYATKTHTLLSSCSISVQS